MNQLSNKNLKDTFESEKHSNYINSDNALDQIDGFMKLINDSLNMIMLTVVNESQIKNKQMNDS